MPLKFRKELIAAESFESAAVYDVDGDGVLDIVSGSFWYQGPDFRKRHFIGDVTRHGEYWDDFSTIPMDIAGNGRLDFVTGGWWGKTLRWRENPGKAGEPWKTHIIGPTGNVETTKAWDIDGDGELEILPNTPNDPLIAYKLIRDASGKSTGKFKAITIFNDPKIRQGHGLGFGDIRGNGRGCILLAHGWLEPAPTGDPLSQPWTYHADFGIKYGASIPMLVVDVNGDGLNDIIVGGAHSYGLEWLEQQRDSAGKITWKHHPIDPFVSQYHDMIWIDIDGDGQKELVTGKRFRAHCGNDPGEFDPIGIYYFKWNGESFSKHVISHGMPGDGVGCGIYFDIADLRKSGRLDIVAPGKDGLYVLWNEGM
jgi:hypothetical protein